MSEEKIQLLKDVYEHIILQYKLLKDANEKLSQKATNLTGFTGVILGITISLFIGKLDMLSKVNNYSCFFGIAVIVLLFVSIFCFLTGTKIRTFTSLITPSFLVKKFEEGISREIFWKQFVKGVKKAYEENKKINKIKSKWIKSGNYLFIISLIILIGYTVYLIVKLRGGVES